MMYCYETSIIFSTSSEGSVTLPFFIREMVLQIISLVMNTGGRCTAGSFGRSS